MDTLVSAVALFSRNDSEMLFYLAEDESGGTMLCATPADLTAKLRQTLWRTECSFVLTSGTLAVGNDFQRYRTQVGLREERRVQESVARSPFDYHEHCLRYLPLFPPKQRQRSWTCSRRRMVMHWCCSHLMRRCQRSKTGCKKRYFGSHSLLWGGTQCIS